MTDIRGPMSEIRVLMTDSSNTLRVVFGSVPKDCGIFTFYRNVRPALKGYGIDPRCVTVGKREAGLIEPTYVDEGCVLLAEDMDQRASIGVLRRAIAYRVVRRTICRRKNDLKRLIARFR